MSARRKSEALQESDRALAERLEPARHLNLLRGLSPTTYRTTAEVAQHTPRHRVKGWPGTEDHWVGPMPGGSTSGRLVALRKKGLVEQRKDRAHRGSGPATLWLLTGRGEDVLWHAGQLGRLLPTEDSWVSA